MPIDTGAISNQFMSLLGRKPTTSEVSFLSKFMEKEDIQPQEIGQYLQGLPEFQQAQLERNTTAYGQRLSEMDQPILQQGANIAGAQAQSRFAGLGRPQSSAMAAQVFGQTGALAQDLAQRRQSALADFYGRGLGQTSALQQSYGQGAIERAYGLGDERRRFDQEMSLANLLYQRQKDMYGDQMNRQSRMQRQSFFGGLGGAALGMGAGALLAAPTGGLSMGAGAMLGGSLGSGLGSRMGGF